MIEDTISNMILKQCNKLIKKIDRHLMWSLKRKPYGYGEYEIRIESKDMRRFVANYYENLGYTVEEFNVWNIRDEYYHYLRIKIKDWYK